MFIGLLEVIHVKVAVAARPDELSHVQVALLGEHVRQQCIAGDIEGNAEKEVSAALVQLEVEPAAGNLGLEQAVAGRERHAMNLAGVPGSDDLPPRIRILTDKFD